jgi:hypothetical protein
MFNFDFNQLNVLSKLTGEFNAMEETHKYTSNLLGDQSTIVKNTADQLVSSYKMYGQEELLKTGKNFINEQIEGLNKKFETALKEFDPSKLLKLPELGNLLEDRLSHLGHEVPLIKSTDEIVSKAGEHIQSLLPASPHPQHLAKDLAGRVFNRTGQEIPPSRND